MAIPQAKRVPAHRIRSDEDALAIAGTVAARLAEGASERDQTREVPGEQLDWLSQSGLLAITVPREYGGAQVSYETVARVFQIVAAADPAVAQLPQSHFVFLDALRQDGSPGQKAFFFEDVLAGARFGNAQAERGSASALDFKTRLIRHGDGYRLSGVKYYCTGALTAHWIPVAALDEQDRLVLAYVRREAPGVTVRTDWNAMGQRTTYSGTTILDNVEVDPSQVVPHWRLFERPSLFHAFASLLHAAIDVGIAGSALRDGIEQIRKRKRPRLGAAAESAQEDSLLLLRLGQLATRLHAAEAFLLRAAGRLDTAEAIGLTEENTAVAAVEVGEAKAFAEDVAVEIGSEIFALIGSASTDESINLNRHWRNARTHSVHDSNQWRYHASGNFLLNGIAPGKPVRRPVEE